MKHLPARRNCLVVLTVAAFESRVALAALAPASSEMQSPCLHDCMLDFWPVYDAGRGQEVPARARALVHAFFQPHAEDYRRAGIDPNLRRVMTWLPSFDAMAAGVRLLHRQFANMFARNLTHFVAALPDFDNHASPVALLPSLFQFDAHLQPDGQQLPLFFGADGIVRFHGSDAGLGVLFAHELFHCYQAQKNPSMSLDPHAPVFANLWMEGVATYASERLNPDALLQRVLLDDVKLSVTDPGTLKRVAQALLTQFNATEDAAQTPFFDVGYQGDWPPRAGYFVGLLAARKCGATMTLPQMAALPTPRVRELLAWVLRDMAA